MNSDIVMGYKNHKKKILLEYCKVLEQIIFLEKNLLWKSSKDFTNICRGILEIFVDKNYFDNNYNRENPIEYLNACSNGILTNIVDYHKSNEKLSLESNKSETFLLSVIIGSACYIDAAANIVDGESNLIKQKLDSLLTHLSRTNFLVINKNDKVLINRLYDKIKKNIFEEKRFFEMFDDLDNHNTYQLINEQMNYYLVKFVYKVPNVDKYDKELVNKYNTIFKDKFLNISYDLLLILLLKENLLNKKVNTYLIPLPNVVSNKLLKRLKEPAISSHLKFLIPLELIEEKKTIIEKLKELGFNVVYYYNGNDSKVFEGLDKAEVLCKEMFFNSNKENIEVLKNKGINIIKTNVGVETSEDIILGKKEE